MSSKWQSKQWQNTYHKVQKQTRGEGDDQEGELKQRSDLDDHHWQFELHFFAAYSLIQLLFAKSKKIKCGFSQQQQKSSKKKTNNL